MASVVVRSTDRRADDVFFTVASVLMLLIVLIGFAPSYFLRGAIFAPMPSLLVRLHGAVFSSWIFLFVIQTGLVSSGNVRLHRKLGVLGAVIASLMIVLGVLAPFGTLRRGAVLPPIFTPASFLWGNVFGILIFGAYVAFALWKRNNRKVHKRVLFIANTMLMEPALGRIPYVEAHPALIGMVPLGMILALFVFDLFTWRRPLAVTIIGGFIFVASDPVVDAITNTPLAQSIAVWAQHHP